MAAFLSNQLDFIFFFYGMAFILLGATCWAVARAQSNGEAWALLGGFAFFHGVGEWLDLTALIVGDSPAFAAWRTALMTLSFLLLLDFARLEATRLGSKLPGRWIHVLLALAVGLVGIGMGVTAAGIAARYGIGFVSAMGASLVLARQARTSLGGAKSFGLSASLGFALYAVAAGLIVPAGPFWPSTVINHGSFLALTGMPIQLVRGFLACWISLSIWGIWSQQLASHVASPRYTSYVRQQFTWTLVAMGAILVSGWALTEYLGGIYRENVEKDSRTDIALLASRLASDTATVDAMVKALAGSPSVLPLLTEGIWQDRDAGQSVVELDTEASGAKRGYILDATGRVVASSNRREALPGAPGHASSREFLNSMAGSPDYQFAPDPLLAAADYSASQPIRAPDGRVIGVAVLTKSLDGVETDLRQFDRPYFFVDPDGVVVMTNRPDALHRTLWPLTEERRAALAPRFGARIGHPMLDRAVLDSTWINVDRERNYVRRRFVEHSDWSLVILKPTREIFATRFLGLVITLLVTIMTLIYLLGRARRVHDEIQMNNREKLQELARTLGVKAMTDPLTGLHNRLKLGPTMVDEMQRADRYKTPLSLVLFDVDHFKRINDTYGHPVGDQVLIQLSRLLPNLIRSTDVLARWGGEEFLILAPGSDGAMTYQAAEKLREAIGSMVFDRAGSVTCSFGVTQYVSGETAAQFIARADAALYRAKSDGRNKVKLAPQSGVAVRGLASVA